MPTDIPEPKLAVVTRPPQWDTFDREVECPLCGYNLRGLTEARCPECGYQFRWEAVLAQSIRHPYLFEHYPKRNWWSFWKTAIGGLSPGRFWRSILPVHQPHARRLVLYWVLTMLAGGALLAVDQVLANAIDIRRELVRVPGFSIQGGLWLPTSPSPPPTWQWPTLRYIVDRADLSSLVLIPILYVLWPWLTLATMVIFRISMRRARIKPVHMLRCMVYSFDAGLWGGLLAVLLLFLGFIITENTSDSISFARWNTTFDLVLWLFMTWRLTVAFRHYLNFDHPVATVIASQVILYLLLAQWVLLSDTTVAEELRRELVYSK